MRTLIFATTYVDTPDKLGVLKLWLKGAMRDRCDIMLIDSASTLYPYVPAKVKFYSFANNIGHLSRSGQDGWGRAFCMGLDTAIEQGYDYVAHVEGDSVLLPSVYDMFRKMRDERKYVKSIHVSSMPKWIETGFMLFDVRWLKESRLTERYDWKNRTRRPEPEVIVGDIVGTDVEYMTDIRGMRDDFNALTVDNVDAYGLDWLTHASVEVMEKFAS